MERNTITTIDKILVGDRFYKSNDKNKTVFTKIDNKIKVTHFRTYRFWGQRDGNKPEAITKETSIVFLRHQR